MRSSASTGRAAGNEGGNGSPWKASSSSSARVALQRRQAFRSPSRGGGAPRGGDGGGEPVGEPLQGVIAAARAQHLLERDHVGRELRDHEAGARRVGPAAGVVPHPAGGVVG